MNKNLLLYSLTSGIALDRPESLKNNRTRTICISGHREKSIIPYKNNYAYQDITIKTVKCLLERYLDLAYINGYDTFISGLAVGADLWAAEHIIKRRRQGADINFIGIVPYLHHADNFPKNYIDILCSVEKNADKLILMSPNPDIIYSSSPRNENESRTLYRDRNYFMVDHSSAIIAFFNEKNRYSGTAQTIHYAGRQELNICRFGLDIVYSLINRYKSFEKIESAIQNIL